MFRRNALLTGCLTFSVVAGTPALAAYAIALNTSSGKAAAYNGSFDLETAKRQAMNQCGRGCRIVASGKGSCAAVVKSISTGTGQWAVAKGTTKETAAKSAWFECRRKGGVNCNTAASICD
jgi:ABC-type glycerol-3-phosphate transport system substrate-binding protein